MTNVSTRRSRTTCALLAVCVLAAILATVSTAPAAAQTSNREVIISLGSENSGEEYCPYSQQSCKWINITLKNFAAGSYFTRCVWHHSESGSERIPISGYVSHGGHSTATLNRYCSFNVRDDRLIYVTIDGVRSNVIRFTPAGGTRLSQPSCLHLTPTSGDKFQIEWCRPRTGNGGDVEGYEVTFSRPEWHWDDPPAPAWRVTKRYGSGTTSLPFSGRHGTTYTVTVAAYNSDGLGVRRSAEIETFKYEAPQIAIEQEGRSWLIDDPDLLVKWDRVAGFPGLNSSFAQYQLDWRYKTITSDDRRRLREIFDQLQTGNLSEPEIELLSDEAARLLDGREVHPSSVGGDSKPRSGGRAEVVCVNSRLERTGRDWSAWCKNRVTGREDRFDWYYPEYRVHSNQEHLIFEARVQAQARDGYSAWSQWAYHPSARLAVGCQALELYNDIKNIKDAIAAISIGLTVAGVATSLVTGGSGVVGATALKQAAKVIVKKLMTDVATRQFVRKVLKAVIKNQLSNLSVKAFGFMFGCLAEGLDLSKTSLRDLVEEMFIDMRDEGIEKGLAAIDPRALARHLIP